MNVYTYTLQDTLNGKANAGALEAELREEVGISIGLSPQGIVVDQESIIFHFKAVLSSQEQTLLNQIVASHDGKGFIVDPDSLRNDVPSLTVSTYPPRLMRFTAVSHQWTDPTTWYSMSEYVEDENVTLEADLQTGQLANVHIIDVTHGKLWKEDDLISAHTGLSYKPVVKVNGVVREEQDPDYAFTNDPDLKGFYTIDYAAGIITFNEALNAGNTVTVSYHYATTSDFILQPDPGKVLDLSRVEVQFTEDVSITDTIIFTTEGLAEFLAPDLVASGTLEPTDYVPVGRNIAYKTFYDYCNEANGTYPITSVTTAANPTWRDGTQRVVTFPWDYQSVISLDSAWGLRVRVHLKNDRPFRGTFATSTFYGFVK